MLIEYIKTSHNGTQNFFKTAHCLEQETDKETLFYLFKIWEKINDGKKINDQNFVTYNFLPPLNLDI